jgi:uncharacterized protein Yka (UPF0111/DUF47 family)
MRLAEVGVECASYFRQSDGQDLPGVVAFEKRADVIVDSIHELLDNTFIMRFEAADAMRLTDAVDDVVDGMRRAAAHVDIYKTYLAQLRPEARDLIAAGERAIIALRDLIRTLQSGKLSPARSRELAQAINEAEADADQIIARAERGLVAEFSKAGHNMLQFIALERLYAMLEQMTDDAKKCGKLVISLARKES